MLSALTWIVEALGMVLALWLAAYLVSYGFRSPVTRGTAVTLTAMAAAFLIELLTHEQPPGLWRGWWAIAYTVALIGWYNLSRRLFAARQPGRWRWLAVLINVAGALKIVLVAAVTLLAPPVPNPADPLVIPFSLTPFAVGDLIFLLTAAAGTLLNFRLNEPGGYWPYVRPLWLASWLAAAAVVYNLAGSFVPGGLPLLGQDLLLIGAIALGGYAVARYQAFVDFRPLQRELPASGLATLALVSAYGLLAAWFGVTGRGVVLVLALAVVTHALYNLVHAVLDQLLNKRLAGFRQELRQLARRAGDDEALPAHLQAGLETLVGLLGSPGGFVAVRRAEVYTVVAAVRLLTPDQSLAEADAATPETTLRAQWGEARAATWLVPAFAGDQQVAVIGLAPRMNGIDFALADIDLIEDVADWVGRLVAGEAQQAQRRADLRQLAQAVERDAAALQSQAQTLVTTLEAQPDRAFARAVETALQQFSDYTRLGASPLVAQLRLEGATHIERGKALRQELLRAVESLRPAAKRPDGVLPREWQAYTILHDAYVEDLPNREIMARLYISEGTYNRMRRRALQAVAQALHEGQPAAPAATAEPAG